MEQDFSNFTFRCIKERQRENDNHIFSETNLIAEIKKKLIINFKIYACINIVYILCRYRNLLLLLLLVVCYLKHYRVPIIIANY